MRASSGPGEILSHTLDKIKSPQIWINTPILSDVPREKQMGSASPLPTPLGKHTILPYTQKSQV